MTERLYYHDSYLRQFDAHAVESAGDGSTVYLDRTAFYPTSGGQPFDLGSIGGVPVREVVDEGDRIAHLLAESATIDLEGGPVDARVLSAVEARANELVWENRPVSVAYEEAGNAQGLRKASDREGTLLVVSIDRLDRSACGGTHVRATGEIGAVLLRKVEKVRQTVRVEFLCGSRAVLRARADYEALNRVAQLFSSSLDEVPAVVAAQMEAARAAEKVRRKLELDLAGHQGRELYQNTAPGADGVRRAVRQATSGGLDELRALAQSFTAQPQAVFVATLSSPPSVLLATSADSGVDAGQRLKAALAEAGGRGGGTARMAQGSVPDAALLAKIAEKL